jgi:selenocysteine-specific elongation factor
LSESEAAALTHLRKTFELAGLEVAKPDEIIDSSAAACGIDKQVAQRLFHQLLSSGETARVNPDIVISMKVVDELIEKLRSFAGTTPDRLIDVAKFKEIAGVSRKYAIPLLEYLDQRKIMARRGDKRIVI